MRRTKARKPASGSHAYLLGLAAALPEGKLPLRRVIDVDPRCAFGAPPDARVKAPAQQRAMPQEAQILP